MIFFNVTYTCMRPDGAFCISAKNISSGAVDHEIDAGRAIPFDLAG
jgi:hypothetical protein